MRDKKKKSRIFGAIICLSLLSPGFQEFLQCQESQDSSRLNEAWLKRFGSDFKDVIAAPGHWHQEDILTFSVLLGTAGILYGLDQDLFDGIQESKSSGSMDASRWISKFGKGGYLTGLLAALYLSGEIVDKPGLRATALLGLESFLTTSAVVLSMKTIFGRARPNTGKPSNYFRPFSFSTAKTSFPSGDAAGAFAVATTVAEQTDGFILDALAYGLAGLVAYFRVHDEKHWPSDVFVGSALGYFIAKKISALNRDDPARQFQVEMQISSRSLGLNLSFSF